MRFEDRQLKVRRQLHKSKITLLKQIPGLGTKQSVKLELWVRTRLPRERELRALQLWCSSEAAMLSNEAVHLARMEPDSPYLAMRAFAEGRAVGPMLSDVFTGRWSTAIGVPIWLDDDPWRHLPVGTVSLFSADDKLKELSMSHQFQVVKELTRVGVRALSPRPKV